MTRRDFFRRLFPRHTEAGTDAPAPCRPDDAAMTSRQLFEEAMRLGIDPATVDPRRLAFVVEERKTHTNTSTTDSKGASGSDLAGLPDALRRPQQRGGPDGDERQAVFVP